jgi:molybdate/tungstate transport system permease protein
MPPQGKWSSPQSWKGLKIRDPLPLLFIPLALLLLLFVVLPLLSTIVQTPLQALWQTVTDRQVLEALGITFYAAMWATVLALLTGVPLAYLLARYKFPLKTWVEGLINLPIVIPHTAAGIALLMVFGRNGTAGRFFGLFGVGFTDTVAGIVVGMLFVSLPFLVNAAREAFAAVDPELEAMALTLGGSRWQAFRYVTLPLAIPGITAGAVMMWGRGISEFGAVIILAYHPKTVPVLVFERLEGFGLSYARPLAVVLILAALAVFVLLQLLLRWQRERNSG